MTETIKWDTLNTLQRNALIAEKIFGWQWINYTYSDAAPPNDQLWLLPSGEDAIGLSPGEWMYYGEDEEGNAKDNRRVPTGWIAHYCTDIDDAWSILHELIHEPMERIDQSFKDNPTYTLYQPPSIYRLSTWWEQSAPRFCMMGPCDVAEAICIAGLEAIGIVVARE